MAVVVQTKKGKSVTLLNPNEKATKFCDELRNGSKQTNDGHVKFDKFGYPLKLTEEERAYRAGYLGARSDNAKVYKYKKKKRAQKAKKN